MRRRHHPHVDLGELRRAEALDLLALEDAEELRLQLEGQLADLVEEDRAAVGRLERAGALPVGAGERAPLVTEELGLDQVLADRAAVHDDEGLAGAWAVLVDRARAASSFPVPVSPTMMQARLVGASLASSENTDFMASVVP